MVATGTLLSVDGAEVGNLVMLAGFVGSPTAEQTTPNPHSIGGEGGDWYYQINPAATQERIDQPIFYASDGTPSARSDNFWLMGFAVQFSDLAPGTTYTFCAPQNTAVVTHFSLQLETDGDLVLRDSAGTILHTQSAPFTVDTWHYIEVAWESVATAAGSWELWLDRNSLATGSAGDFQLNLDEIFFLGAGLTDGTVFIDDRYLVGHTADLAGSNLGPTLVLAYQSANADSATPDSGLTDNDSVLDLNDWGDTAASPANTTQADYDATPHDGAILLDTAAPSGHGPGPSGGAHNVSDGTIQGAQWVWRLGRGGGSAASHEAWFGNDGTTPISVTADLVLAASTETRVVVSEVGTEVPTASEVFAIGFGAGKTDTGGREAELEGQWGMLLFTPDPVAPDAPPFEQLLDAAVTVAVSSSRATHQRRRHNSALVAQLVEEQERLSLPTLILSATITAAATVTATLTEVGTLHEPQLDWLARTERGPPRRRRARNSFIAAWVASDHPIVPPTVAPPVGDAPPGDDQDGVFAAVASSAARTRRRSRNHAAAVSQIAARHDPIEGRIHLVQRVFVSPPGSASTITFNLPHAPVSGHLLVLRLFTRSDGIVILAGWRRAVNELNGGSQDEVGLFYKVSDGTEQDTTWTLTTPDQHAGMMAEFKGLDDSEPLWTTNSTPITGLVSSVVAGSISVPDVPPHYLLLAIAGLRETGSAGAIDANYNFEGENESGPPVAASLYGLRIQDKIGGTYNPTFSWTTARAAMALHALFASIPKSIRNDDDPIPTQIAADQRVRRQRQRRSASTVAGVVTQETAPPPAPAPVGDAPPGTDDLHIFPRRKRSAVPVLVATEPVLPVGSLGVSATIAGGATITGTLSEAFYRFEDQPLVARRRARSAAPVLVAADVQRVPPAAVAVGDQPPGTDDLHIFPRRKRSPVPVLAVVNQPLPIAPSGVSATISAAATVVATLGEATYAFEDPPLIGRRRRRSPIAALVAARDSEALVLPAEVKDAPPGSDDLHIFPRRKRSAVPVLVATTAPGMPIGTLGVSATISAGATIVATLGEATYAFQDVPLIGPRRRRSPIAALVAARDSEALVVPGLPPVKDAPPGTDDLHIFPRRPRSPVPVWVAIDHPLPQGAPRGLTATITAGATVTGTLGTEPSGIYVTRPQPPDPTLSFGPQPADPTYSFPPTPASTDVYDYDEDGVQL